MLDAGASDTGEPYLVMELVDGKPLTAHADRARLADRLRLFIPVCKAVQHAHQKGIIHRDLKPSNVLVAMIDGVPTPKVIDFGLAKAIHGLAIAGATMHTQAGMAVGTMEYMSPEQSGHLGLNKGEARNSLARAVFFYRRGAVRDRLREDLQNKASGLNLVVAAIILWNTVYLEQAVAALEVPHSAACALPIESPVEFRTASRRWGF